MAPPPTSPSLRPTVLLLLLLAASFSASASASFRAAGHRRTRTRRTMQSVDEIQPAPASIGTDVPATYFGPPPSAVQKELIGPYQLLKSGTIDLEAGTITLPLYRGSLTGQPNYNIWYIVTDTDDANSAAALGINLSSKLTFGARGARTASWDSNAHLQFDNGTVDFSPVYRITPGKSPNFFPPTVFTPGSMGDAAYTPAVLIAPGQMYNAPIIAGNVSPDALAPYCNGIPSSMRSAARAILHDKVKAICPSEDGYGGTVTLELTTGFSFGKPVLYLSTEASYQLTATLERATWAPGLGNQDTGGDDSFGSAVERIFVLTNGFTNGDINPKGVRGRNETAHPLRQGLNSAVRGDGFPLNVLGGIPTVATDYSPFWDLNVGSWTDYAIQAGYRTRMLDEFTVLGNVARGYITAPGGGAFGSFNAGITNCPPVYRFL